MPPGLIDDSLLKRFCAALDRVYGDRIERVVLFGSRARGDAGKDSDYDVAVFLRHMTDRFAEMNRLADLSTQILDETGEFIHAMPYPAGSYNERTPLMLEVRAVGVDLLSPRPPPFSTRPASSWRRRRTCLSITGLTKPAVRRISPGCMRRKR
jgi:predicted nucleotidyltransferase